MLSTCFSLTTPSRVRKSFAALAIAAVFGGAASAQTTSTTPSQGNFSNFPNYLSVVYDLQTHTYGAAFLNQDGSIFGKQYGTLTPPTTVNFNYTGTSGAGIPEFLNVTDNQVQVISKNVFNSTALSDLVSLWQSGSNSVDASYGETYKLFPQLFPKETTSDFFNLGILGDYKQLPGATGAFTGRAQAEAEYTVTLFPAPKATPKAAAAAEPAPKDAHAMAAVQTKALAVNNLRQQLNPVGDSKFEVLSATEARVLVKHLIRLSQSSATPDTGTVTTTLKNEKAISEMPEPNGNATVARIKTALGVLHRADVTVPIDHANLQRTLDAAPAEEKASSKFRALANVKADDLATQTYSALAAADPSPAELREFAVQFTAAHPWFGRALASNGDDPVKAMAATGQSASSVNEQVSENLATKQKTADSYAGATLKLYVHGFSWIDSGPGAKLDGFAEGGLVLNFGKATSTVTPGISLTALTGDAPTSVTIGKPYFRLMAIIPF